MQKLVVVDGSNIATEGRAMPSLRQLHEAVMAFRDEHPDVLITVVVDATFGHRIEPAEVPEFDAAVEHNELVTPPAGAVGRGDAFVLTIANKANATILSNDSFQEFHGQYPWLFDEGRLIGGKPVPHVGWVFVPRTPVRGPTSRKAVRTAKTATPDASRQGRKKAVPEPLPELSPQVAPPSADGKARRRKRGAPAAETVDGQSPHRAKGTETPTPGRQQMVNELLPFLTFVEEHPVGTGVSGVTDSYSSHGAYVIVDETRCYVPLRYLGRPAPRSAREVLRLGDPATFTVVSFNPARRSIDLALTGFEPAGLVPAPVAGPAKRSRKRATAAPESAVEAGAPALPSPEITDGDAAPAPAKRTRKKAAAPQAAPAPTEPPAKRTRKKAAASVAAAPEGTAVPATAKRARTKASASKAATPAVESETSAAKAAAVAPKGAASKAAASKAAVSKTAAAKAPAAKRVRKQSAAKSPATGSPSSTSKRAQKTSAAAGPARRRRGATPATT